MSDLMLKAEQVKAISVVYSGSRFLSRRFKSICCLSCSIKLGLVGSQKKKCVIVISSLISLMVYQVRSPRTNDVEAVVISRERRVYARTLELESAVREQVRHDSADWLLFRHMMHYSVIAGHMFARP